MARLVCFRHPTYTGDVPPELSCRACCGIFIAAIKADRDRQSAEDAAQWKPLDVETVPNKFAPTSQGTPSDGK